MHDLDKATSEGKRQKLEMEGIGRESPCTEVALRL
jgi:hypothetical protein